MNQSNLMEFEKEDCIRRISWMLHDRRMGEMHYIIACARFSCAYHPATGVKIVRQDIDQ